MCTTTSELCTPFTFTMASSATSTPTDSATGLQSATKKARSAYEVRRVLVIDRARPREGERGLTPLLLLLLLLRLCTTLAFLVELIPCC